MRGSPNGGARFIAPAPSGPLEATPRPPSFSVVIAAFQAAGTIATAVESALAQTSPAHEVIVVDDGSTDDLRGVLAPLRDRIVLVEKANGGVASARNAGLEVASGDFLAVLDADDRFHPTRLEALAELAKARPDLDLVTTDTRFVVDGAPRGTFLEANPFETEDQVQAIFDNCFVGGWPAARIDRLREIGGFDEELRVAEDWDCWLRLIVSGSRAGMVDEPLYDYVLHEGSLTSDRRASLWARVAMLRKAAGASSLSGEDRAALRRALRRHRARAVKASLGAALPAPLRHRRRGV